MFLLLFYNPFLWDLVLFFSFFPSINLYFSSFYFLLFSFIFLYFFICVTYHLLSHYLDSLFTLVFFWYQTSSWSHVKQRQTCLFLFFTILHQVKHQAEKNIFYEDTFRKMFYITNVSRGILDVYAFIHHIGIDLDFYSFLRQWNRISSRRLSMRSRRRWFLLTLTCHDHFLDGVLCINCKD